MSISLDRASDRVSAPGCRAAGVRSETVYNLNSRFSLPLSSVAGYCADGLRHRVGTVDVTEGVGF